MNAVELEISNKPQIELSTELLSSPSPNANLVQERTRWQSYLTHSRQDKTNLSNVDQYRLALTEYFHELQYDQNRTIFHLTITYKPYQDRIYTQKDVDVFFKKFYVNYLLPKVLHTKNIHTAYKKSIQPITYVFAEEHNQDKFRKSMGANTYLIPQRLHHHAILAVHPVNLDFFQSLPEINPIPTDRQFTKKICTSHIRPCEPMTLLYASSMISRHPDFLCFPDKFHREHH